jgi:hypothetical protein
VSAVHLTDRHGGRRVAAVVRMASAKLRGQPRLSQARAWHEDGVYTLRCLLRVALQLATQHRDGVIASSASISNEERVRVTNGSFLISPH